MSEIIHTTEAIATDHPQLAEIPLTSNSTITNTTGQPPQQDITKPNQETIKESKDVSIKKNTSGESVTDKQKARLDETVDDSDDSSNESITIFEIDAEDSDDSSVPIRHKEETLVDDDSVEGSTEYDATLGKRSQKNASKQLPNSQEKLELEKQPQGQQKPQKQHELKHEKIEDECNLTSQIQLLKIKDEDKSLNETIEPPVKNSVRSENVYVIDNKAENSHKNRYNSGNRGQSNSDNRRDRNKNNRFKNGMHDDRVFRKYSQDVDEESNRSPKNQNKYEKSQDIFTSKWKHDLFIPEEQRPLTNNERYRGENYIGEDFSPTLYNNRTRSKGRARNTNIDSPRRDIDNEYVPLVGWQSNNMNSILPRGLGRGRRDDVNIRNRGRGVNRDIQHYEHDYVKNITITAKSNTSIQDTNLSPLSQTDMAELVNSTEFFPSGQYQYIQEERNLININLENGYICPTSNTPLTNMNVITQDKIYSNQKLSSMYIDPSVPHPLLTPSILPQSQTGTMTSKATCRVGIGRGKSSENQRKT